MMKDEYIDQYGLDSLPKLREASKLGIDTFLTLNYALLEDRAELEEEFNIRILTPEELQEEDKNKEYDKRMEIAGILTEWDNGVCFGSIYEKIKKVME